MKLGSIEHQVPERKLDPIAEFGGHHPLAKLLLGHHGFESEYRQDWLRGAKGIFAPSSSFPGVLGCHWTGSSRASADSDSQTQSAVSAIPDFRTLVLEVCCLSMWASKLAR
jgi:hypothetical protein